MFRSLLNVVGTLKAEGANNYREQSGALRNDHADPEAKADHVLHTAQTRIHNVATKESKMTTPCLTVAATLSIDSNENIRRYAKHSEDDHERGHRTGNEGQADDLQASKNQATDKESP